MPHGITLPVGKYSPSQEHSVQLPRRSWWFLAHQPTIVSNLIIYPCSSFLSFPVSFSLAPTTKVIELVTKLGESELFTSFLNMLGPPLSECRNPMLQGQHAALLPVTKHGRDKREGRTYREPRLHYISLCKCNNVKCPFKSWGRQVQNKNHSPNSLYSSPLNICKDLPPTLQIEYNMSEMMKIHSLSLLCPSHPPRKLDDRIKDSFEVCILLNGSGIDMGCQFSSSS